MEGHRFLRSVRLSNLLSFGGGGTEIGLEPLNVLIGANASGKSNLIDALRLLAAAPRDLQEPTWEGGGADEWIWKGVGSDDRGEGDRVARIEALLEEPVLRYGLAFTASPELRIFDEFLEERSFWDSRLYWFRDGKPVIRAREMMEDLVAEPGGARRFTRSLLPGEFPFDQSILSRLRDAIAYPELTRVGDAFGRIRFYRAWSSGTASPLRSAQAFGHQADFLVEDGSNLGVVLHRLLQEPGLKDKLLAKLQVVDERAVDLQTRVQGRTVEVFLSRNGLHSPIPSSRMSGGILRWLCLLALLLHPEPPPLLCIDGIETGLHPDLLDTVGEMLVEAAQRVQLIVTTQSDFLVSALWRAPEAVVICESDFDGATTLRRLEPERLKGWLESHTLGELWAIGELGGNRW